MHIYFSGIGGVGLGPLAEIALDAGYEVSGSDISKSSITEQLERRGATVHIGQEEKHIDKVNGKQPIDWLVYTAALPADHPDLKFAKQHKIRISKRDELLAKIIKEKNLKLIAVAGTHGKTTTTAMLVWLFKNLDIPISYSVGTTINFGPSGSYDPASNYFVYECDEYDRNMLHFHPDTSIIPSLGYDHPDTYATQKDYNQAFRDFIAQSRLTVTWRSVLEKLSLNNTDDIVGIDDTEDLSNLRIAGEHNRRNAFLVASTTLAMAIGSVGGHQIFDILEQFPGTGRRFERLAKNLYSDYGHHPAEIKATLQMACELSDHVALVYQPHQNIRQHEIQGQYTDCMQDAEIIYWLPTYLSREDPNLAVLTPKELSAHLTNREVVAVSDLNEELWQHIKAELKSGTLVLAMGAGSIDGWLRQHLAAERLQN